MIFQLFKQVRSFLFVILILLSSITYNLNIIFDLGNVLIKTDRYTAFSLTGHSTFLWYAVYNPHRLTHLSHYIRHRLYSFIHLIKPYDTHDKNQLISKDEHGNTLPQIMIDWLKNDMTNQEIRSTLLQAANQHPEFFTSDAEQKLIRALITFMFSPEKFTQALMLDPHAPNFVKQYKQAGHKLYILSNFDTESYLLLQKKYAQFFALFDGIVISGDIHQAKPKPDIYRYLLETYQLNPAECIFIDDRIENRIMGEQLGISCFFKQRRSCWAPWQQELDFDALSHFMMQANFAHDH